MQLNSPEGMEKGESSVSKSLYKLEIGVLKVIPLIIAGCYFLNTTLSFYDIEAPIFSYIGGLSLMPWLFLYLSSFVFKFCLYHRLPLYYVLVSDLLSYYDLWIGIPLSDRNLFVLHDILAGSTVFLVIYFKFKICHH